MKNKAMAFLQTGKAKVAGVVVALNGGLLLASSTVAHAAETTPAPSNPIIDSGVIEAVSVGFDSLLKTVTSVLVIAVPAVVGIICTTTGVKFALKKIKGAMNQAS